MLQRRPNHPQHIPMVLEDEIMFLSVVVPVYNCEKYLAECLRSFFEQDLADTDYEVICVDDGSTDSSSAMLSEWSNNHPMLRLLTQENLGVSAARNNGLALARGDYVWFVDSDDFIARRILGELWRQVTEAGCPDLVKLGAYSFQNDLTPEETVNFETGTLPPNTFANNTFVTRNLFRRSYLIAHAVSFPTDQTYSEDKVFLAQVFAADPRMFSVELTCYYYRYHAGSIIAASSPASKEKRMRSWYRAIKRYRPLYDSCPERFKQLLADSMMSDLYAYLFAASQHPMKPMKQSLELLRAEGLFPFRRLKECTLKKSYQTSKTGIIGKIYDFLYLHGNTRLGFCFLRMYKAIADHK